MISFKNQIIPCIVLVFLFYSSESRSIEKIPSNQQKFWVELNSIPKNTNATEHTLIVSIACLRQHVQNLLKEESTSSQVTLEITIRDAQNIIRKTKRQTFDLTLESNDSLERFLRYNVLLDYENTFAFLQVDVSLNKQSPKTFRFTIPQPLKQNNTIPSSSLNTQFYITKSVSHESPTYQLQTVQNKIPFGLTQAENAEYYIFCSSTKNTNSALTKTRLLRKSVAPMYEKYVFSGVVGKPELRIGQYLRADTIGTKLLLHEQKAPSSYQSSLLRWQLPLEQLYPGVYTLQWIISDLDTIQEDITIEWLDMPIALNNGAYCVKAMKYVLNDDEVRSLESSTDIETRRNIISLWNSKFGSPSKAYNFQLAEYFRRVDYAKYAYHSPFEDDGVFSSRGRICILYGSPLQQDVSNFTKEGTTFEVWNYPNTIKKSFTFIITNKGKYILDKSAKSDK